MLDCDRPTHSPPCALDDLVLAPQGSLSGRVLCFLKLSLYRFDALRHIACVSRLGESLTYKLDDGLLVGVGRIGCEFLFGNLELLLESCNELLPSPRDDEPSGVHLREQRAIRRV